MPYYWYELRREEVAIAITHYNERVSVPEIQFRHVD